MKYISDSELPYIHEYFLKKNTFVHKIIIWIIFLLISFVFVWISIFEIESVVKSNGYIRPLGNISTVVNGVSGNVENIYYKANRYHHKDDLLFKIDINKIQYERKVLILQLQEDHIKLDSLYQTLSSIKNMKNMISVEHKEARLRYELWNNSLDRAQEIINQKRLQYLNESSLPILMTTKEKIHEYKIQFKIAEIEYSNIQLSFQYDIEKEIQKYEMDCKRNENMVKQLDEVIMKASIKSPISGYIQEITPINIGDYVQSGQIILKIIPHEAVNNKVELYIPAGQAAKLSEGMAVKMNFPSLPYDEFGGLSGEIISIDPDITKNTTNDAYFMVIASLPQSSLRSKKGKEFPLRIGLQVEARIIVSSKSILFHFLEMMNLWY